jgi:hypothetical protein
MFQTELSHTDTPVHDRTYTLSRDISAIQILPSDGPGAWLSPVSKLPRGARIQAVGDRNGETLKVAFEGHYYLVFVDDLEAQRKTMTAAH